MKTLFIFSVFYFVLCDCNCYSQHNEKDTLLILLKTDKSDTNKLFHLNNLSYEYYKIDSYDSSLFCLKHAIQLSDLLYSKAVNSSIRKTLLKEKAYSYSVIGCVYYAQGNYQEALKNNKYSFAISKLLNDKEGIANSYVSIGNVFYDLGNFSEALKNNFASLKIYEETNDKYGIASIYNNIGNIYSAQGTNSEALKNYLASLKIKKEIGDQIGMAKSYNNIGCEYRLLKNYSESIKNHLASLKIKETIGNKRGMANSYGNIGSVYDDELNYSEAIKNHLFALKLYEEIGDQSGIASTNVNVGLILIIQKKYNEAEKFILKGKELSKEIGYKECLRDAYSGLTDLYSEKENYKSAYENHKLFILYRDSLDNEETRRSTIQTQMTYEFEKKEAVATAEHKKELENQNVIANEKSRKQNLVILFIVIGLLVVIIFAGFIFRSLKITRKQKKTIENQKQIVDDKNLQLNQQNEEISTQRDEIEAQRDEIEAQRDLVTIQKEKIEEIHKDVTDSINYAKRIQEAVLPVSDISRSVLGDHFILFKPKDIVSGDFYWTIKIKNWLIVAVADCTGHGVPGAFMSMLGISFLNEIVQKQEINKANEILNHLRVEIINALQQKGVQGEQKDGMDISLLVVNTDTNEAQWAGANNPLYIVKSEKSKVESEERSDFELSNFQLYELKGDKMPIAIYPEMKDFTNHDFILNKGDSVYLFTDGYADQFGGTKGKKFMYKQFKELLLQNNQKSMVEQKEILDFAFENWKSITEQIDDVTVLGIKFN